MLMERLTVGCLSDTGFVEELGVKVSIHQTVVCIGGIFKLSRNILYALDHAEPGIEIGLQAGLAARKEIIGSSFMDISEIATEFEGVRAMYPADGVRITVSTSLTILTVCCQTNAAETGERVDQKVCTVSETIDAINTVKFIQSGTFKSCEDSVKAEREAIQQIRREGRNQVRRESLRQRFFR